MNKININGIEYVKEAEVKKEMVITEQNREIPFKDDKCYFIRTITYHIVGRVHKRVGNFLLLEDASWVADSGRFMNAIKEGKLDEVEPVGDAIINIDAITDVFPWDHKLPNKQK